MRSLTTRWAKTLTGLVPSARAVAGVTCVIVLAGCSAASNGVSPATATGPARPSSLPATSPRALAVPSVPADGITLGNLGFRHGPLDTFSLPRPLTISTTVDQPNAVTVVMSAPSLIDVAAYLRRALPAGGYTITAQDPAGTMTFTGQGWTGNLTGDNGVAAVTLAPT